MMRAPKAALVAAICILGCSSEPSSPGAAGSGSAKADTAPSATAAAPTASATAATPAPTATAPGKPRDDCPQGSSGEGTLANPCEAKGKARMMEVTWTGKMTDTGPSFKVTNTSKLVILYGKLTAYFYDKAGKQLEVKDASGKTRPNQPCFGNVFGGVMNAGEKATITFSCVKKDHVPEGTAAVEVEVQTVGFADKSGKKSEFYWQNKDLAPDTRPKGGVK
jgi:pyruvate/2-oxoglutarate dehydrogenase complex dihydrolipoamide acyltransferase (E2) component